MKCFAACIAFAAMGAAPAFADQNAWPDLFRKAFSQSEGGQIYAYDFFDERGGEKPGTIRGRVDPSKPKGQRVTIYEATGEKVDLKKIDKRYEKNADDDIWCDQISGGVDGPVTDKGAGAAGRLFTFRPLPKPDAESEEKNIYKKLIAEVAIDEVTASIRTFNASLTEPMSMMVIAKVDAVTMTGDCSPAPNGRPFASRMRMVIAGSAFGGPFNQDFTRSVSNLTPAR